MPPPSHHSHARFQPPDPSKGDESTIGGYMAVHDRPAAFEGSDGFSYSVEIMYEETGAGERERSWGAFFLFIKWARLGAQTPEGHLETDYLTYGSNEADARRSLGMLPLERVKILLDALIAGRRAGGPERHWWDAMRDDKAEGGGE